MQGIDKKMNGLVREDAGMDDTILTLEHIQKKYGKRVVLQDINLEVKRGQAAAFVGSNGSGKSTLMKVLSGLIRADSGRIISEKKVRFAYVPEKFPVLPVTAEDYLFHVGEIARIPVQEIREKCKYYFEQFDMADMIHTSMKFLSKGTLQKVVVIQALLSQPDILLLDEPLSGQDVSSQQFFMNEITKLKKNSMAVIVVSHEEAFVQQIADMIYRIRDGRLETEAKNHDCVD